MTRTQLGMTSALMGAVLMGATLAAQEPKPKSEPGDRAGERIGAGLDSAVQSIKKGARDLAGDVRQGFAKTRQAVHHMGVESRVYGRLHWDKALTGAEIEVNAKEDGVVTLRGAVPDLPAKIKAETLTRETVGVTRVDDQLTVGPALESTTTTTKETTTDGKTIRKETRVKKSATPQP